MHKQTCSGYSARQRTPLSRGSVEFLLAPDDSGRVSQKKRDSEEAEAEIWPGPGSRDCAVADVFLSVPLNRREKVGQTAPAARVL